MATTTATANNEGVFSPVKLPVEVTGMQAMANRMWIPFIAMGFMIVVVAFIIGLVNSAIAADYFSASKAVREAAERGSDLAPQKAFIEATKAWLPAFKFLGMGMLMGGVTFLLATILGALRVSGGRVQEALGVDVKTIKPPPTAKLFPMVMMMGTMTLVAALVIGIVLATVTYDYWNHSIAAQLDPSTGALLADLGTINAISHDRSGAALAGQPAVGDPVLSPQELLQIESAGKQGLAPGRIDRGPAPAYRWMGGV